MSTLSVWGTESVWAALWHLCSSLHRKKRKPEMTELLKNAVKDVYMFLFYFIFCPLILDLSRQIQKKRNEIPPPTDTGGAVKCQTGTETWLAAMWHTQTGWQTQIGQAVMSCLGAYCHDTFLYVAIVIVIICASLNERDRDRRGRGMLGHCCLYRPLYIFFRANVSPYKHLQAQIILFSYVARGSIRV